MASKSVQRTTDYLRDRGILYAITQHWNGQLRIRQDMFGMVDVVALLPGTTLYIQATIGRGDVAAHIAKVTSTVQPVRLYGKNKVPVASPAPATILEALVGSGAFEIWSWAKRGERGKRKLWTLRKHRAVLVGPGEIAFVQAAEPQEVEGGSEEETETAEVAGGEDQRVPGPRGRRKGVHRDR